MFLKLCIFTPFYTMLMCMFMFMSMYIYIYTKFPCFRLGLLFDVHVDVHVAYVCVVKADVVVFMLLRFMLFRFMLLMLMFMEESLVHAQFAVRVCLSVREPAKCVRSVSSQGLHKSREDPHFATRAALQRAPVLHSPQHFAGFEIPACGFAQASLCADAELSWEELSKNPELLVKDIDRQSCPANNIFVFSLTTRVACPDV